MSSSFFRYYLSPKEGTESHKLWTEFAKSVQENEKKCTEFAKEHGGKPLFKRREMSDGIQAFVGIAKETKSRGWQPLPKREQHHCPEGLVFLKPSTKANKKALEELQAPEAWPLMKAEGLIEDGMVMSYETCRWATAIFQCFETPELVVVLTIPRLTKDGYVNMPESYKDLSPSQVAKICLQHNDLVLERRGGANV